MIKLRIELKSEGGETLDIFEQMVTGSDNVGMLLDGVRTMINNRLAEVDEGPAPTAFSQYHS